MSKLQDYLERYSGQQLLKNHSLDDYGSWVVRGEDPNCDFGGSHYQPVLGYFTGQLRDVVEMACELPQFWTWGGGGDIQAIAVKEVDKVTTKKKAALRETIAKLDKQIAEAKAQLEKL